MGIKNAAWQEDLILTLKNKGISTEWLQSSGFTLLKLSNSDHLLLNLVAVKYHLSANEFIDLQTKWKNINIQVIHLWEDIWMSRRLQVLGRITALLGMNKTVHGRKTEVMPVTQKCADDFFNRYHLQGSAGCKYRLALRLGDEIIAIAGFSAKRKMVRRIAGYTSVELVRFATIEGVTVIGGLSKLIKYFIKMETPSDIMSYADLDWSIGHGYMKSGFQLITQTEPMKIFLDITHMKRYFPQRLPAPIKSAIMIMEEEEQDEYLKSLNYETVFNTGNLKYVLYL